jgi:peroxiredoxin
MVGPDDYRQHKNLIVVFVDGPRCPTCGRLINELISRYGEIRSLNGEVLAILSPKGSTEIVQTRYRPPFPLLFDPDERAATVCLGSNGVRRPAVIVADRFGTVWMYHHPKKVGEAVDVQKVVEELRFIQIQCPECGVPDSPPPG